MLSYFLTAIYASVLLVQPAQSRNLVFYDDFNGTAINTTNWNIGNNCDAINQERQCYVNDTSVIFVNNGSLFIKPQWQTTCVNSTCYQAVSGKLTSMGKFEGNTGRYEFNAKLPSGSYMWPALWLLLGKSFQLIEFFCKKA